MRADRRSASSSGRIGRVFTGVAAGFQDAPDRFSLERIQEQPRTVMSFGHPFARLDPGFN